MSRKMKGGNKPATKLTKKETGNFNIFFKGDKSQSPITKRTAMATNAKHAEYVKPSQRKIAKDFESQPWFKKLFPSQQKHVQFAHKNNMAFHPIPNPKRAEVFG